MMLQRTLTRSVCHSHSVGRLRTRSFHAWSGAALSRYLHMSDDAEPLPESSRRTNEPSTPVSEQEMAERRERLQELLQRVNAERADKQKTG